jgi:hypothetical protein
LTTKIRKYHCTYTRITSCYDGDINNFTIDEFQSKLRTESWEDISEGFDTNVIFKNFLNIHLNIFMHFSLKDKLIPQTDITHR